MALFYIVFTHIYPLGPFNVANWENTQFLYNRSIIMIIMYTWAISHSYAHRIHGAGIYMLTLGVSILMGSMLPYIAYMDPMGIVKLTISDS